MNFAKRDEPARGSESCWCSCCKVDARETSKNRTLHPHCSLLDHPLHTLEQVEIARTQGGSSETTADPPPR